MYWDNYSKGQIWASWIMDLMSIAFILTAISCYGDPSFNLYHGNVKVYIAGSIIGIFGYWLMVGDSSFVPHLLNDLPPFSFRDKALPWLSILLASVFIGLLVFAIWTRNEVFFWKLLKNYLVGLPIMNIVNLRWD